MISHYLLRWQFANRRMRFSPCTRLADHFTSICGKEGLRINKSGHHLVFESSFETASLMQNRLASVFPLRDLAYSWEFFLQVLIEVMEADGLGQHLQVVIPVSSEVKGTSCSHNLSTDGTGKRFLEENGLFIYFFFCLILLI